ncbi:ankyrin repeat domain-containing protein 54-like [Mya arenaria]|uniref:ankyrin repeat domain-containing protein 54-like n=1 Tax=Mya arenaria TaxID=6604 RepID=UPI0022DF71CE|nr:ankyrin repeat domain-containing protein 54-like [Mya arenaria]
METDSSESDSDDVSDQAQLHSQASGFQVPQFEISGWNPRANVGIHLLSLVPMGNFPAGGTESLVGKSSRSRTKRKQRMKAYKTGRTSCRNVVDERRLRLACSNNDCIAVVELLEGGADPSCADEKNRTPLHLSASQGYETIVKLLLDKGADPNRKDFIGNTPLHLAACTCQVPIVTLLLKAGTNLSSVDQYGRTPLTLAKSRLSFLAENKSFTNDKMKTEVVQISDMMGTYLRLTGSEAEADQLEELCTRLSSTSTREQVDEVGSLLAEFTCMSIEKKNPNS